MTPTQDFENYPEFANSGQKSQPNDAKYSAGFIPSDVLPAEWLNWFLSGATKGVTALNTGVKSIEQEINTVLESRSVNPDINAAGQLLSVLNKIKAEAVLAAHPVGSLYWTSKNENPAITFGGGTWKQITDKFVLAAGSKYKVENTGGEETATLTIENMPSHSHSFTPSGTISMNAHTHGLNGHSHKFNISGYTNGMSANETGRITEQGNGLCVSVSYNNQTPYRPSGCVSASTVSVYNAGNGTGGGRWIGYLDDMTINVSHSHSFSCSGTTNGSYTTTDATTSSGLFYGSAGRTSSNGSGAAFFIMPPYVVKYCWERTA